MVVFSNKRRTRATHVIILIPVNTLVWIIFDIFNKFCCYFYRIGHYSLKYRCIKKVRIQTINSTRSPFVIDYNVY